MKNNYAIIMAGGVGSRFWPFSTQENPKQFLDILGIGKSLIQLTFERLSKVCPKDQIFVVTNDDYADLIDKQLPEIPKDNILFEPVRRNTAPCVAYGCYKIHDKNPNAKILVAPSDHLIIKEEDYLNAIRAAFSSCAHEDILITLGIKPTRPDTGYGYIQATEISLESNKDLLKVKTFTEKPNKELAEVFFESGDFSWNSGMFIWSSKSIVNSFKQNMFEIHDLFKDGFGIYCTDKEHDFIQEIYAQCVNISVDYAILEKADNVYVLPCDIGWTDLGTWGALYNQVEKDSKDNAIVGKSVKLYNSVKNIISNPTDKLIVIDGLEDYIVVNTSDALLICKKDNEQKIKQFVTDLGSTKEYKKFI
ncbi:MAG: mannose-1-phosphate guanylyltransferase [Flavobacteriales bacterium]|nr:mannose-1-phosphate guanylyltransferase [Flavobacteriales bacterium]